jgi:hypothetical protein
MKTLIVLVIAIGLCSCDKDDANPNIDWDTFKTGVIHTDFVTVSK